MACITASKAFNESSPRRLRHLMSLAQLQWHQLGHLATQFFYRPDALSAAQPTASMH